MDGRGTLAYQSLLLINEDIVQNWVHYWPLVYTTSHWPATGLCTADHHHLIPDTQFSVHLSLCLLTTKAYMKQIFSCFRLANALRCSKESKILTLAFRPSQDGKWGDSQVHWKKTRIGGQCCHRYMGSRLVQTVQSYKTADHNELDSAEKKHKAAAQKSQTPSDKNSFRKWRLGKYTAC